MWKRAYHKFCDWLGGVVYEDPWLAGGHNGLSNSEDPRQSRAALPAGPRTAQHDGRFRAGDDADLHGRRLWYLREWADWIDNPELGPIAFQFGTRPLLTQESPISDAWKRKLLTLGEGDVYLNRFSPTGFYSSAVRNGFLERAAGSAPSARSPIRSSRSASMSPPFHVGARSRVVYLTPHDRESAERWVAAGSPRRCARRIRR